VSCLGGKRSQFNKFVEELDSFSAFSSRKFVMRLSDMSSEARRLPNKVGDVLDATTTANKRPNFNQSIFHVTATTTYNFDAIVQASSERPGKGIQDESEL